MRTDDSFPELRVMIIGREPNEQTYASWDEQLQSSEWQAVKALYADTV